MLVKKLFRDMWNNRVQFFSIFIMAALSTYIFVGMASLWYGLEVARDTYYTKSNYAEYMLSSNNGFVSDDVDALKDNKKIKEVDERYTIYNCVATNEDNADITVHILKDNIISKSVIMDGVELDTYKDGVWLDYRYAKDNKLEVGDSLVINVYGVELDKEIKGLVINPEYIYQPNKESIIPNHKDMGFVYMTYESNKELLQSMRMDKPNELLIKVKEGKVLTSKDISESIDNYGLFKRREDILSHSMFNDAINQYRAVGTIFPIAFLAVTVLVMLTTMTRLVDKQRTQIGTLGTLGLKKGKIYRHYLAFGAVPSFVGCIIGFIIAPITLPYVYYKTLENLYTMEYWKPKVPIISIVIVVLCVGLCVVVTYTTIRKVLKEKPAQAIKPKVSSELANKDIFNGRFTKKLSFSIKWNLIDMIKGKGRVLMTLIGILGCMGLLVAGFGLRDSLSEVIEFQYEQIYRFNTKLLIDTNYNKDILNTEDKSTVNTEISEDINKDINQENIMSERINNIKNVYSNVDFIYEGQIEIESDNKRKITNITVEDNIKNIKYVDENDKMLNTSIINNVNKKSIYISRKLAESLEVKESDVVKFRIVGTLDYYEVTVADIYLSPVSGGIIISKDVYESLGYKFTPNYALATDKVKEEKVIDGILKVISKDKLKKDYLTTRETIDSIALLLTCSAVFLVIVVLYNLNMLSLYEKKNEFALLKVMGFKSSKIRNLLLIQTLIVSVVGVILGIPFGLGLIESVLISMGDSMDISTTVAPLSYILSIVLTLGTSVIMNLLFIFNIKNIDMIASLKD